MEICRAVDLGDVPINEVAWTGTNLSASDEWIELKNLSGNEISLEGWTLIAGDGQPSVNLAGSIFANGFFLLERTDDASVSGITADLIYSGALGNSGEILELRDEEGTLIYILDASAGWPAGDNDNKFTMERMEDGGWQNSSEPGGTPRANNSSPVTAPEEYCGDGALGAGEECDDGNNINNDGCSSECAIEGDVATSTNDDVSDDSMSTSTDDQEDVSRDSSLSAQNDSYGLGDVAINEFVSDPSDEDIEWIELYNTTSEEINLEGWTIEEGSGAKTMLEGSIENSGAGKFYLIEKPKGNLNNSGDIIILRDKESTLIDQVAYGNWDDGNTDNNAPAASDPFSVARKADGYNTFNNENDFSFTSTLTKSASNIITNIEDEENEEISQTEREAYDFSGDIIISEIFPNPKGSDSPPAGSGQGEGEFIELYNKGEKDVNLSGWRLGDESSRKYKIESENEEADRIIKANEFFVIYRVESKIALNNSTDSVKLFEPLKDSPLEVIKYEGVKEGQSYARKEINKNSWDWTEDITPGNPNSFTKLNHPPVLAFDCPEEAMAGRPVLFDSSDTVDEDGDELKYFWDFGDKATNTLALPEHTYWFSGAYTVKLSASDGISEVNEEKIIKIVSAQNFVLSLPLVKGENEGVEIIINELLPNPEGADAEGEFIEIFNNGLTTVNLIDWRVDDAEGGSKAHTFKEEFLLGPGKYYVLWREESSLALNNTNDAARLFYGEELIDEVEYSGASEGEVYALGKNNKWFWTTAATPGEENIISLSGSTEVLGVTESFSSVLPQNKKSTLEYSSTTLEKVREFETGDLVTVSGVVAVLPGVLGTQYFYIVGSPGIQVYNYKKEFPELRLGDLVEVSGELSVSNTEMRLKTKSPLDIKLAGFKGEPEARLAECDKIDESSIGELITVAGEVVERKSSNVYLDDGTDEIKIYIKTTTGIDPKNIKEGEMMSVSGILGRTTSGLRLMPRFTRDIVRKDPESREVGRVLGEVAINDEWAIAARDRKIELFKYLLVIAGGAIILLSGLLIKLELNKK